VGQAPAPVLPSKGLPLHPTWRRRVRLRTGSGPQGPGSDPGLSSMGLVGSAQSELDSPRPAPAQARSGLVTVAQSRVRLLPRSAACGTAAPSDKVPLPRTTSTVGNCTFAKDHKFLAVCFSLFYDAGEAVSSSLSGLLCVSSSSPALSAYASSATRFSLGRKKWLMT
jgi:hypothetical protein